MGIPTSASGISSATKINAMPFAAYQKVYNDYYRDQNLISPVIGDDDILTDGDNYANRAYLISLRKRAWQHDCFTSALPSTQFGNAVRLPIS